MVLTLCTTESTGPLAQPGDLTLRHSRSQGLSWKSQDFVRLGKHKSLVFPLFKSLLGGTGSSCFCVFVLLINCFKEPDF